MQATQEIEQWPWAPGEPIDELFLTRCLEVVGQPTGPHTPDTMRRSSDPLEIRRLAIDQASLSNHVVEILRYAGPELEPYVAEHPDLPAAVLHGVYQQTDAVDPTGVPSHLHSVVDVATRRLYEAKIGRESTAWGPEVTDPAELTALREEMWARRVPYDSPQFAAELKALVTPPRAIVAHVGQRGLDDIELPDLTECGCDFSADRIKNVGAALYYRELARFGAIEAIDNLGKKFMAGEVHLGAVGNLLYPYQIDRANRDRDEEFQKIAEAPFADGRIEGLITELLTDAIELDEAEAHEKDARTKAFKQTARELRCVVSEAGCGILSFAATDMVTELSTALQVLGSDEVQCAIGGPSCCGGSVLTAIEELTPDRARPPREEVAAWSSVGREVINMLAEKPLNAKWRRKIIKLAYRGLSERQQGQRQLTQQPRRRELPRVTGDSAERNGAGIVTLKVRS